jgi:hypothetical protein
MQDIKIIVTVPGPRNWQPLARTAAHKLADSCCGFWCCRMSSVTVRSPRDRAARIARDRPSSSISWQLINVTTLRCIGLDRTLMPPLPLPIQTHNMSTLSHLMYTKLYTARWFKIFYSQHTAVLFKTWQLKFKNVKLHTLLTSLCTF